MRPVELTDPPSRDLYPPKPHFAKAARVKSMEEYRRAYARSLEDPAAFWGEHAQRLDWFHPPTHVLDADARIGLHDFEARLEQQLFHERIADLHGGPLLR